MVIAVNKKGQKQQFSDLAWRMLGKEDADGYRSGYREQNSQKVENTVLPTGETKKPASKQPAPAQKVDNTANAPTKQSVDNTTTNQTSTQNEPEGKFVSQPEKDDFLEAVDGVSGSAIKDFLDKKGITYRKKANVDELQELLGSTLNWNIPAFQKAFE
jgi:hypothetical protein